MGLTINEDAYESLAEKQRQPMQKNAQAAGFYLLDGARARDLEGDFFSEANNG